MFAAGVQLTATPPPCSLWLCPSHCFCLPLSLSHRLSLSPSLYVSPHSVWTRGGWLWVCRPLSASVISAGGCCSEQGGNFLTLTAPEIVQFDLVWRKLFLTCIDVSHLQRGLEEWRWVLVDFIFQEAAGEHCAGIPSCKGLSFFKQREIPLLLFMCLC